MNAVEITSFGAPDVLRLGVRPAPIPGKGELLIRVSASGINRPDVLQRTGNYPVPPGASDIPGLEVAGVVVEGDMSAMAAAGFSIGDRVCALVAGGGYAELWSNVFERARLLPGETLLIQGGSSGIGVTAIQIAKALGATVLVTAGSDEKCAACLTLGADHAINYKTADFAEEVKKRTNGRGVDVILDMVAGSYIAREVECLAEDGRLVIIAVQGGIKAEINAGLVLRRRLTITGSTLRPRSLEFKTAIAKALKEKVWPLIASGTIKPVIHSTFAAGDAAKAHALMESNQHIGKIVLIW